MTALKAVVDDQGSAGAEALVSLARLGHGYAQLTEMLDSHDYYRRLNAALALAYLDDKSALDRLLAMQREASTPFERIYLAAALAMLGKPNGATELNAELVAAAGSKDFQKRVDLFFVHRYLQTAVLYGLAAGGAQNSLDAWRAETEPLDPMPQPVVLKPGTVPARQSSEALSPRSREHAITRGDHPLLEVVEQNGGRRTLRVFLCHSSADKAGVRDLFRRLAQDGCDPWLDEEKLVPGQKWAEEIPRAVRKSDVVVVCMSRAATAKRGYLQKEITFALDIVMEEPEGSIFLIPARLEECEVPDRLRDYQWVNLYEQNGYARLLTALRAKATMLSIESAH